MTLLEITSESHGVVLDIAYATARNFTGKPVYARPGCYLHADAAARLRKASTWRRRSGCGSRSSTHSGRARRNGCCGISTPDPEFLADPRRGSPHSRGVAVDLTLIDADGGELDMGTGFDAFTPLSHHANTEIRAAAQRNRLLLLGLMSAAGWDFYGNEWWHYQLFDAKSYPVLGRRRARPRR